MRIAVFGLGYVGTVTAVSLAQLGHNVTGVDVEKNKVLLINKGVAPIVEPGLKQVLAGTVASGALKATTSAAEGLADAEVVLVCVGTPAAPGGGLDLACVERVIMQIAENLSAAAAYPVIAIRSTIPPGTIDWCAEVIAAISGMIPGKDFGVVANPEFLREGSALADFHTPSYTLVGTSHPQAAAVMKQLYENLAAPFKEVAPGPAEIIKFFNNGFHAVKIAFANEVGRICKAYGIDSQCVMDLLCSDTKLNISAAYLKPGFAYGGSCLPKDLAALTYMARSCAVDVPLLEKIAHSNNCHIEHSVQRVTSSGNNKVGFLGISFKANTDDLRESPAVKLVEQLVDLGYEIKIYDTYVNPATLTGSNQMYMETHLSHLAEMLVETVDELVAFAGTIVVTNNDSQYCQVYDLVKDTHHVVDLTRLAGAPTVSEGSYDGICW